MSTADELTAGLRAELDRLNARLAEPLLDLRQEAWKKIGEPAPPPECKTDAEKTAFAFGWFKALETARRPNIAPEPFAYTDSYGNLWTKSAAQQLIDKSILLPLYVGKPEH